MRRPPYETLKEKASRVILENQIVILLIMESKPTLAPMAMRTDTPVRKHKIFDGCFGAEQHCVSPPHRRDKASLRRPPAILENQITILLIIESKSISTPTSMMLELPEAKR